MREFDVVTPPFAMSAADLWTLRMDLGWDEYFAELDGQTLALVSLTHFGCGDAGEGRRRVDRGG